MKNGQNVKRKIALLLSVVLTLQSVFTGSGGVLQAKGASDNRYPIAGNPSQAFSNLSVYIGDTVGEDNTLTIRFDGVLDDEFLAGNLERGLDGGKFLDETEWEENTGGFPSYDDYLDAQESLPEITFSSSFSFPESGGIDIGRRLSGDIITEDKQVLGYYEMVPVQPTGTYKFTGTLRRMTYNRYNVAFGQSVSANLEHTYQNGTTITTGTGGGDNDFTVTVDENGKVPTANTGYTISKSVEDREISNPAITFVISAKASSSNAKKSEVLTEVSSGSDAMEASPSVSVLSVESADSLAVERDLRGTEIIDRIPDGLTLVAVKSRINSEDDAQYKDISTEGGYTYEQGVLSYIVPVGNADPVKTVDLKIYTRLSDELYNQYMISGKGAQWSFPNRATLKDVNDVVAAVSKNVDPQIKLDAPFEKDGKALDSTNRVFEWTLNVNSQFSNSGVTLYAVDHIQDVENTHDYRYEGAESGITIGQSEKKPIILVKGSQSEEKYAYDKILNVGVIDRFLAENSITDTVNPIVYKYTVTDKNGEKTTDAVMLIPLSDHKNQEVVITYVTDASVTVDGLYPDSSTVNTSRELKNEAKVLWKWPVGEGPGPGGDEFGGATIGKTYPVDYSLVKKTSLGYDEVSNTITWNFEVNQIGAKDIKDFRIEDELKDSNQLLTGLQDKNGNYQSLILTPISAANGEAKSVPYQETDSKTGEYYTILQDENAGTTTFVLFLSSLTEFNRYNFQLSTFVTDKELGSTGNVVRIKNKAHVTSKVGQGTVDFSTETACPVTNTLIQKAAIPFDGGSLYNYEENTVKWRITINPYNWNITNAHIMDELPSGTVFKSLTKASKGETEMVLSNQPEGNVWTAATGGITVTLSQSGGVGDQKKLDFAFADENPLSSVIHEPFIFEFTTYVEETLRKEFKSTEPYTLLNKATLTGQLNGGKEINAHDTAANTISPEPMKKSGQYKTGDVEIKEGLTCSVDYIDWVLYVNRTGVHMGGAEVTDEILKFMELIPSSMKVYKVELNQSGQETEGKTTGIESPVFKYLDYDKFIYEIPELYKDKTLKFEFTTVMVDDAYASEIDNKVSINYEGKTDVTGKVDIIDKKDFHVADYARAANLYFTKIYKTSANESDSFPLQGAEFEIYEMIPPAGNGNREIITDWKPSDKPFRTKISNKRGSLNFMFLKPDTMYRITEKTPPTGYAATNYKWYIVPKVKELSLTYPSDPIDSTSANYEVRKNDSGVNYVKLAIKNSPKSSEGANGSLSFFKTGQNGQPLENVDFTISYNHLNPKKASSGADGGVTFKDLDPIPKTHSYEIREVKQVGYQPQPPIYGKVYLDGTGNVVTELQTGGNLAESNGVYTLSNRPVMQSGSFTKEDQNGDALIGKTVEFAVERRGDGGNTLTPDENDPGKKQVILNVDGSGKLSEEAKNTYVLYEPCSALSSDSTTGIIAFKDFVYGDYKLTEKHIDGLKGSLATVYLKINENGAYASDNPIDTVNQGTRLSAVDGKSYSVTNEMQYGIVQVNKVLGEKDFQGTLEAKRDSNGKSIPLEGIEFKIYRDLGSDKNRLVMTLVTNKDGKFTVDEASGEYITENGRKKLIVGNYILVESRTNGYDIPTAKEYPFSIKPWVDTAMNPPLVIGNSTVQGEEDLFLNEPFRGTVTLTKEDAAYNTVKLSGAGFKVYTNDNPEKYVADFVEDAQNPGKYILTKAGEDGVISDLKGRDYLEGKAGELRLLYGRYLLQEIKTPENYQEPTKKFILDVNQSTTDQRIENRIITQDIEIKKWVELRTADGSATKFGGYEVGTGFRFKLSTDDSHKGPINMPSGRTFTPRFDTTGNTAKAIFEDVPMGSYVLEEVGIPKKYGTMSNSYIQLMDKVGVIVTAEGVVYEYVEDLKTIPEEAADAKVTTVLDNTLKTAQLIVRNNYKLGSASGIKVSMPVTAVGKPISLVGAEFTLTNEQTQLSINSNGGKISFTHIPYGTYTLRETKTPLGYQTMPQKTKISITENGVNLGTEADNHLENTLIQKSLKFTKVDQNGDLIDSDRQEIKFSITGTHEGYTWPEDYVCPATVSNAEDGTVTIENLAYGTYRVTEIIDKDSTVEPGSSAGFTITVGPGTAGKTLITMALGISLLTLSESTLEKENSDTAIYDFTDSFKLPNKLKHGELRIHKIRAEADSDIGFTATEQKLSGIEFEIYDKDKTLFASLITDERGEFKKNFSGKYVDANENPQKELVVGEYFLKEKVQSVYKPLPSADEYTPFSITDIRAGKVTEFTYNGIRTAGTSVDKTAADTPFYNIPDRGALTVTKKDGDLSWKPLLSGAEFGVSLDEGGKEPVALLKEGAVPGQYVLASLKPGESDSDLKNNDGIPYLYGNKLLQGTYYVKETKAPAGYNLSNAMITMTVERDKDGIIKNKTAEFENTLETTAVQFLKVDQNGDPVKTCTGDIQRKVDFTIERLESSGELKNLDKRAESLLPMDKTVSTDADGMVSVENLVAGSYKLTEKPSDWVKEAEELFITVTQTKEGLKAALGKSLDSTKIFTAGSGFYEVVNDLKYALVNIQKVAADDNTDGSLKPTAAKLPGVVFRVYEDLDMDGKLADTENVPVLELVTGGTDGSFRLDDQNRYLNKAGVAQEYRMIYGKQYLLHEEELPEAMKEQYLTDTNYYPVLIGADMLTDQVTTYYLGVETDNFAIKVPTDIKQHTQLPGINYVFPNGKLYRGSVVVNKTDIETQDPVSGAKFDIYMDQNVTNPVKVGELLESTTIPGTYELHPGTGYSLTNDSGQEYLKLQTDGTYKLLAGKYYIKEVQAPNGYITPEEIPANYVYFQITGEKSDFVKDWTNAVWRRNVVIEKQVEGLIKDDFHKVGTQDDIFTFRLTGTPSNALPLITQEKTVSTVGSDQGKAVFENIPSGIYTITELMTGSSTRGGTLSDVYKAQPSITVIVDEFGVKYDTVMSDQILVKNELKRGSITGRKVTKDMTGEFPLAGATFQLTATNPDMGDIRTVNSDLQGRIVFTDVPLGTYELKEIAVPPGYEVSSDTWTIHVETSGQTVVQGIKEGVIPTDIKFVNKAKGSLTIEKQEEFIENRDITGVLRPGEGFVFKIFGIGADGEKIEDILTEADITGADKVEFKNDGIYVTTGAGGKVVLDHVPVGDWKVQEQENEKNDSTGEYVIDAREKPASIKINHETGQIESSVVKVENVLKRSEIQGLKTQGDRKTPLKNAVIGLFPGNTVEFTEENLWCGQKVITGEDGVFRFINVPYGTYQIRELKAPSGYYLNEKTIWMVSVEQDGSIITTGMGTEGKDKLLITNVRESIDHDETPPNKNPDPDGPVNPGPGVPTESETQETPGETAPNPLPIIPAEPNPGGGITITVPDAPPGTDVVIENSNEEIVFRGETDEDGHVQVNLAVGEYTLITLDENRVPLAAMVFTIEEQEIPLGIPNAGDSSVPAALLAVLMLGALAGMVYIVRRKKENK